MKNRFFLIFGKFLRSNSRLINFLEKPLSVWIGIFLGSIIVLLIGSGVIGCSGKGPIDGPGADVTNVTDYI